ncbi:MAG: hypothetical protein KatS3mg025_0198 [Bacteroidia bacterium]|nr:MAG: hypothetical protein KatS3mg025_0198 [Bacteroidia bacterium]
MSETEKKVELFIDASLGSAPQPAAEASFSQEGEGAGEKPTSSSAVIQVPERDWQAVQAEVARLREEVAEWKDRALRTAAEWENYRKRMQRELPQQVFQAQADLLRALFPVLDSLQRGVRAAQAAPDIEKLQEGLSLMQRQIHQVLQRLEIEVIEPQVGGLPNPELHEVLSTVPAPEGVQPPHYCRSS